MTHITSVPINDDYTIKTFINSENVLCFTVSNIQTKYHYLCKNEQSHSLHYDVTVLLSLKMVKLYVSQRIISEQIYDFIYSKCLICMHSLSICILKVVENVLR